MLKVRETSSQGALGFELRGTNYRMKGFEGGTGENTPFAKQKSRTMTMVTTPASESNGVPMCYRGSMK